MSTPFKMKGSPAKLWPWGKTKKSTIVEGGYETKKKTTTRGDVVKTKTSKRLLAGEEGEGGVLDVISKTKTKGRFQEPNSDRPIIFRELLSSVSRLRCNADTQRKGLEYEYHLTK